AHKEKIYCMGADGCLQKPFSPDELKIKINEILKNSN
ncbi:MAG TPA: response regulator, partial [Elusimicrobia bacterium]|nr:response regulator [Elusimicrobiota bacterium]